MWLCILIGLNFITTVLGYSSGYVPQSYKTMLPDHKIRGTLFSPQSTEPPFEIQYEQGNNEEPITGTETVTPLYPGCLFITMNLCCNGQYLGSVKVITTSVLTFCSSAFTRINTIHYFSVILKSKQSTTFQGFMLEARERGKVDEGVPVGKFIKLEPSQTQLLTCDGSAVSKYIISLLSEAVNALEV